MSRRNHRRSRWGAGGGAASQSCSDFRISRSYLYANCFTPGNAQKVPTGIDMSRCLQNQNGNLAQGGGYQLTCNLSVSGNQLTGTCNDGNGQPNNVNFPIDNAFGNFNGFLIC